MVFGLTGAKKVPRYTPIEEIPGLWLVAPDRNREICSFCLVFSLAQEWTGRLWVEPAAGGVR